MNKSEYFSSLTGIRAIAAYMVFIHHIHLFKGTPIFDFTYEFHIGVSIFFVLSGFLITYRYSDLNNFNMKQYMVNRIARIFPVYFLLTSLTFLAFYLKGSESLTTITWLYLSNITFLRGFFDSLKFSGISQGWSLTVEETFYLLAPLLFFLIKKSKSYLYALPVLLLAFGALLVVIFSRMDFFGFFGSFEFMLSYTFFGRCIEFFAGIGLGIIYKKGTFKSAFNYFTYLGILGIIVSIFGISFGRHMYNQEIGSVMRRVFLLVILPIIGVLPLFYGLLTEKTPVSRVLGSKLFILLGKSSYVFYLIHIGIIQSSINKISDNPLFTFIVLNLISIGLFKMFEEPVNNFIRAKYAARISSAKLKTAEQNH
ncbi:acyltransferase family protein [Flavobacterium silvaticum]|uniref:Acyltransferase n=1 Tax=Flavobacterium silvaticum TaxID=1852020 RepID=A0A972FT63_9FLAO|nr:acyltransferase [Flavobacterium silvaticum]NMH27547.1 acyltransferase [Flavobacterium silvaticum]